MLLNSYWCNMYIGISLLPSSRSPLLEPIGVGEKKGMLRLPKIAHMPNLNLWYLKEEVNVFILQSLLNAIQ